MAHGRFPSAPKDPFLPATKTTKGALKRVRAVYLIYLGTAIVIEFETLIQTASNL